MNAVFELLSTGHNLLIFQVGLPVIFAFAVWAAGKKDILRTLVTAAAGIINLIFGCALYFAKSQITDTVKMTGFGLDIEILTDEFSSLFIFLTAAAFSVIGIYCSAWLNGKKYAGLFMFYLFISLAMINGAFMCDSLGAMLFFWEGLLCTLFGMLLINNRENYKSAVKALTLSGIADLLMMLGIIITAYIGGSSNMSGLSGLEVKGAGIAGFACLMLGALGKSGCMPFHSWIPEAASSAPAAFMAAFPGALEKLLGLYLGVRVMTQVYSVESGSAASIAVMTLGAVTLVCAVAMALVQKDMKKLLSYHAVSQVGYMVLGLGSALPVGIAGALFHMLNNVIYKSALFMIAGFVEKKLGTTDLRSFSGLFRKMPVTAVCFAICGFSIAGVPGFNGFFSKELIFDAALEAHCRLNYLFYALALVGAFMTAVSFLKMGRGAFSGKEQLPEKVKTADEKGLLLKLPIIVMSALCVVFGVFNSVAVDGWFACATGAEEKLGGWPHSALLVIISVCVLLLALADHIYGCKKTGKPINAADHIHYAPVLKQIYSAAEKGRFDPYNWINGIAQGFSFVCVKIEQGVSFVYDKAIPGIVKKTGDMLHRADNGSLSRYLAGVLLGVVVAAVILLSKVL